MLEKFHERGKYRWKRTCSIPSILSCNISLFDSLFWTSNEDCTSCPCVRWWLSTTLVSPYFGIIRIEIVESSWTFLEKQTKFHEHRHQPCNYSNHTINNFIWIDLFDRPGSNPSPTTAFLARVFLIIIIITHSWCCRRSPLSSDERRWSRRRVGALSCPLGSPGPVPGPSAPWYWLPPRFLSRPCATAPPLRNLKRIYTDTVKIM